MKRLGILGASLVIALSLSSVGAQASTSSHVAGRHGVHRTLPPAHHHKHHHRRRHEPNYAWQMFRATNESRRRLGLPRYELNRVKSRLAEEHSLAMAHQHRLFHTSNVSAYLNGVGRWRGWAENIGWTTGAVGDLEKAFMGSPDHRPHILSGLYRHVAVGAVRVNGKLWVTLFFYG
jgi:uncharacterized protein YkwD